MAVAPRWTGLEAAALRQARRMSIRAYATHLGVSAATVANWDSRGRLARLNTETQQLLDIDFARASVDVRERFDAILLTARTATEPPSGLDSAAISVGRGIASVAGTDSDDDVVTKALFEFRIADSRVGGAPLYSAVVAYLRSHVGPRLVDDLAEFTAPTAFNAAASMVEMAGWMAHDRGDDDAAQAHFERALAFTALGGDMLLRSHILGSMSHLAAHAGRPRETIRLARQGQDVLRDAPHSPLRARLLAMEARGVAGLGELEQPLDLLAQAESELTKGESQGQAYSAWISDYDQASLASDAGRCLRRLGDLAGARSQAERIIALRPAHRARSRGLAQLALANILVAQRAVDEALTVANQALSPGLPLQSAPIVRGMRALHDGLAPHQTNPAAAEIRARLAAMLQRGDGPFRSQPHTRHRT